MKPHILFKLSGSIACYKACHVISKLVKENFKVQVACTPSTLNFVGIATLEGLSGRSVFHDIYEREKVMDHIELARWADLTILCPATANVINKMACGIADDAVTTLFLAYDFKKPYLIAPAMNHSMLKHPATQKSMNQLKQWNITVLETDFGHQACGETGEGRLLEPDLIFDEVFKQLSLKKDLQPELNL